MSPADHSSTLADGKSRLGPAGYETTQMCLLDAFQDKLMVTGVVEQYARPASVPLADVAMLTLRQMQHDSPESPLASWPLRDQIAFVQAYFACDYPQALLQVDMEIDCSAQPEVSDVIEAFHRYPVIKESTETRPTLIVTSGVD